MRPTHYPAAAAGRTLGRVITAALSLLVLAAALAGLPLLLMWATPVIWASTHDDLTHLLDRQDTAAAFLLLLVAAGWAGWAQFAFCTAGELIAQLRGRTWHAPRGLGTSQRTAALLIGSILVLLPASSALAFDAQAAPAPTAARLPGTDEARQVAEAAQVSASDPGAPAQRTSYTVRERRPAESLWGIAQQQLGDGERWREIAALNEGRIMADGQVFKANGFLRPGWQLDMPATPAAGSVRAQLGEGAASSAADADTVVTVHSGQYLSKIAQEELGDANAWPQLFEASRGKPQPHGLPVIADPDVIYAGQQVTVPGGQHGRLPDDDPAGSQERTPPAAPKPGTSTGDEHTPLPSQETQPAPQPPSTSGSLPPRQPGKQQSSPSAAAPATPGPGAGAPSPAASAPEPSGAAASPASPAPAPSAPDPSDTALSLRRVLGAGALLAAAVTSALALRRTLQRRRRKPGETITITPQTSAAEAKLAAACEPDATARLDRALRTLAHTLDQQSNPAGLPRLRAAQIGSRTVQVLPEDLTQEPQPPFTAGQDGWWTLAADAALLEEDTARQIPAPYPALVTIGHTTAGDLLLLNLAQMPAVLLDGNPVHITEMCTSLALELAMSPWASDVEIVTIGFGEDLPQLLPTARIAHMRQATHALRDLSERLLEAHQMPDARHQPYLLLCASALDADTAWEFAEVIDKAAAVPVTLIAPAATAAAHFPHADIVNASLDEPQHLDHLGTEITVQRLAHAAYLQITTALKVSAQPAHPAQGPWQDVPDEPENRPPHRHHGPQEPAVPAADTTPSPAPAQELSTVFPALIGATTDPAGLRLSPAGHAPAEATPTAGTAPTAPPDTEVGEVPDLHAPEIRVLGPVQVTGVDSTGHGPRMAQLAALLYFRPGRSADVLCCDMDPLSPWSPSTLNARMHDLRRSLGNDPAGHPYVPRRKSAQDPYRLAPSVRCDWSRFLHLVEHALPQGPAGLPQLEKALELVRGRPFGGRPLPWAEPNQQEMITRIIDTAHTVANYRTATGPHHDLSAARQAITTGLDVDDTAELLYRDWLRIEHAAGNRQGLHTAITRLQHINRRLDCSLEPETEDLINTLLNPGNQP
ncbi:hypothetical protein [Streptomyces asoensis]|uniref:hypothetical protein n=1 Tax=Streptomyces asoensis TaxID=249586 RepID=UPI0033FAA0FB